MAQTSALDTLTPPPINANRIRLARLRRFLRRITDRTASTTSLVLFAVYILIFGLFISHGFHRTEFNASYAAIIIPIMLIDCVKSFIELFIKSQFYNASQDLNKVTVIIACKDGGQVLEDTLTDLCRRFARHQIIVASNGSSDNTIAIARSFNVQYLNVKEALGKVRAINVAISFVPTTYTLIMDDDTLIGDAIIPTGALDDGYSAVAFRVFPVKAGPLSLLQLHEYRKSSDISKKYHNRRGSVQNISGAIGLFGTNELRRQIPLHSGEFAGEDLQRTLLLHLATESQGVVLSKSIIQTKTPDRFIDLYRQRVYGWNPGLYSNFFNYLKLIFHRRTPLALRLDAIYNCFLVVLLDVLRVLALPILLFYPWYFLIMYSVYIAFETIFYLKLGRREPYWVIIVYPLYGLFGLVTRIASFGVFIYRRIAVKYSRRRYLDDYRTVPGTSQLVALATTAGIYAIIFEVGLLAYSHTLSGLTQTLLGLMR